MLHGLDHLPATTYNRFCASAMEAIRNGYHAIRADAAHAVVFVGGVELHSRARGRNSDSWPDTHNPLFADAEALTASRTEAGSTPWAEPWEPGRQPDPYMDAGHAAENLADHLGISRAEMDDEVDEFAVPVGEFLADGMRSLGVEAVGGELPVGVIPDPGEGGHVLVEVGRGRRS
ncbi:hypothetical protein OHB36_25540 [Streptomyces sp. NBC_00320]|uniref:thiolase family protein n=1 Tax=Streptomyces sp. NBC_00320 TaxID=2975711 RepID=UPI00224CDEBE|nr:hypothetical protein [Streptomyces sp. NBC_00320]MCX5150090.1 hypothetical protein [Streptomyces sp. NBC_00320]WSW62366.1 hypothetical protein OG513_29400 [Streptomyces sp. NBC_00998]